MRAAPLLLESVVFAFLAATPAHAVLPKDALNHLNNGIEAYKTEGSRGAIQAWLKGSALANSPEALSQANLLNQISEFYGQVTGLTVTRNVELGPSTYLAYVIIHYETGPLFGSFVLFKGANGAWTVPRFNFHTDVSQIWPDYVIQGR